MRSARAATTPRCARGRAWRPAPPRPAARPAAPARRAGAPASRRSSPRRRRRSPLPAAPGRRGRRGAPEGSPASSSTGTTTATLSHVLGGLDRGLHLVDPPLPGVRAHALDAPAPRLLGSLLRPQRTASANASGPLAKTTASAKPSAARIGVETTGLPAARYSTSFTGTSVSVEGVLPVGHEAHPAAREEPRQLGVVVAAREHDVAMAAERPPRPRARPGRRGGGPVGRASRRRRPRAARRSGSPSSPVNTAVRSWPATRATGSSSSRSTAAVASVHVGVAHGEPRPGSARTTRRRRRRGRAVAPPPRRRGRAGGRPCRGRRRGRRPPRTRRRATGSPTASGTISGVGKRIHRTASAGSETWRRELPPEPAPVHRRRRQARGAVARSFGETTSNGASRVRPVRRGLSARKTWRGRGLRIPSCST